MALVFALVRTETYSWGSAQVLLPLALAIVLLAAFLVLQARFSKAPLVPLRIFRSRSVAGGNVVMFLMFGALFGSWYFETLYMQRVLGYSPLQAGLAFLPQTLLIAAGAQFTARLVPRFGPRPLIILGTLVAGGGLAWLAQISTSSTFLADLFGPFVLIGLGMGLPSHPSPWPAPPAWPVPRPDSPLGCSTLPHRRRRHRSGRAGHRGRQPHHHGC